jgi:hypothetical protein
VSTYQVLFGGSAADEAFYDVVGKLEIEENADLPDAISLQLPVSAQSGELSWVGDDRIAPYANIAVVVTPDDGSGPQCIFDGYVLTQKVHMPTGPSGATVDVWGQDASVLMGLTETVKEWNGLSDVDVAASIFSDYGVSPADGNAAEDSPTHDEDGHTLMQRASDIDFLRRLARRTGRWCRVYCTDRPGQRTGYFAAPDVDADPAVTIKFNDPAHPGVATMDFGWDVTRPTQVQARQGSLTDSDEDGVSGDASDSGLTPLDAQSLPDFAGRDRAVILTATADGDELRERALGLLREHGWFARCEGTADLAALKHLLRVGDVVTIEGCGALLSGNYLVWSVRHSITTQSHLMAFVFVRNAVGATR